MTTKTARQKARAKGNQYQSYCTKWLEERGWKVHDERPKPYSYYDKKLKRLIWKSTRNDIFGCFDLIAKKGLRTLWIQVTTDVSLKRKVEKIEEAALPFSVHEEFQVWIKRASGMTDIYRINHEVRLIGKIIRKKFYPTEGSFYGF